jgi:hypothetical protein
LGVIAVVAIRQDELIAEVHKDAVAILHTSPIAPSRAAIAFKWLTDDGDVVNRGGGNRLGVGIFSAIGLEGVIPHAGALICIQTVALNDEPELGFAAPTLVDIEAVVADVPDAEIFWFFAKFEVSA